MSEIIKKLKLDNYFEVTAYGDNILFRGIDSNGEYVDTVISEYKPKLYIKSNKTVHAQSVYGDNLKCIEFDSIADMKEWKREMKELNIPIYGDIGVEYQFISDLPRTIPISRNMIKTLFYDIETTVMEVNPKEVFPKPELAEEYVTLISTYDNVTNKAHIFFYKEFDSSIYKNDDICKKYTVVEHGYTSEEEMLAGFLQYYCEINPHVFTGWYTEGFDNLYIFNRISKLLGKSNAQRMSPFKRSSTRTFFNDQGKEVTKLSLTGVITEFDYKELYSFYTYHPMANYKLDTVAEFELNVNKVSYNGSFKKFYTTEWDKFVSYSIRDTLLVYEIDKATDLITLASTVPYLCGANLSDSIGTTKKLDVYVYSHALKSGKIIPPQPQKSEKTTFGGGFVMDPVFGMHEAIASFDLNSLYPHLIMEYNISPEKLVEDIPEYMFPIIDSISVDAVAEKKVDFSPIYGKPYTIAPNGAVFNMDSMGIIPEIMKYLYDQRVIDKKLSSTHWKEGQKIKGEIDSGKYSGKELEDLETKYNYEMQQSVIKGNSQLGLKILLNSFFGALGANTFRYYDLRTAEAITMAGQSAIKYIANSVNSWLKEKLDPSAEYIIYIDTDSNYFTLKPLIAKLPETATYKQKYELFEKFCDGPMQDKIEEFYLDFAKYRNCPENKMVMKREALALRGGFWTGKKKYCLAVDNLEGKQFPEDSPYWKIMGLEAIKAGSFHKTTRDVLERVAKLIVLEGESSVQKYIAEVYSEFKSWSVEEYAILKSVNKLNEYIINDNSYASGTPFQARAAGNYNRLLRTQGFTEYNPIEPGEKVSIIYLREPNPLGDDAIAWSEYGEPIEFISKWVDYNIMWEKGILAPMKIMLDSVGFESKKRSKLFGSKK